MGGKNGWRIAGVLGAAALAAAAWAAAGTVTMVGNPLWQPTGLVLFSAHRHFCCAIIFRFLPDPGEYSAGAQISTQSQ